ncbi:MAG: hypothetical protein GWO78_04420 [Dehalococcoidales bacterium]|jgi:hypothetical protein|nr:hypothetical protein [Dehalococcoidia bacterium]NCG35222.1 hypothetical protein [Dehalococcoidales bacterium]
MKKLLFIIILTFSFISCSAEENICSSENILCEFFEIYYPIQSNISPDNAELSETDLDTYQKISDEYLNNPDAESIFHLYSNGIFIPRFSYSILNEFEEEELWLGVALYPVDKKNSLTETLNIFYTNSDIKYASESNYGICNLDNNSYLSTVSTKIYNCNKEDLYSYDYWVEQENYMWRIKCVWETESFYIRNNKTGTFEETKAADTCRKSFKSFKSKIN